jgi:superfamily I DNA/RNA helicase
MPLTTEQQQFANHEEEAFVEACPGAGKTRTVVARLARIA